MVKVFKLSYVSGGKLVHPRSEGSHGKSKGEYIIIGSSNLCIELKNLQNSFLSFNSQK